MIKSLKPFAALAAVGSIFAVVAIASADTAAPSATEPSFNGTQDRFLGNANAPVTVFEYVSFRCTHCAAFTNGTLPLVKNDWINPGKVRWVFRDFPLDPISVNASQIGRCLPTDKFFGYVEAVYKDQANWAHLSDDDAIKHLAGIAGLDKKQTSDCLKNTAILDLIKDERITGEKTYGINMTPYFFVNGERIAGDPPYAQLQVVLQNVSPKP